MTLNPSKLAKDALITALVTLGLSMPVVAYRTEPDPLNRLIVTERWGLVLALCLAAVLVRVGLEIWQARKSSDAAPIETRAPKHDLLPAPVKAHANAIGSASFSPIPSSCC